MLKPSLPNLQEIKTSISNSEVGWKTPAWMLGSYFLAILAALIHFALFKSLKGRFADGPHAVLQTYVAVASHLLGSLFRASLSTALGVAFAQHLWRILRLCPTKISTIEHLYHIRENFLLLAHSEILGAARLLFAIAALIWLIPVAVIYPPAALTVTSSPVAKVAYISAPTLNLTGSTSGPTPNLNQLLIYPTNVFNDSWAPTDGVPKNAVYGNSQLSLNWASKLTLQSGRIPATTSPCGINCTFLQSFVGPYLKCSEVTSNDTSSQNVTGLPVLQQEVYPDSIFDYYVGDWTAPAQLSDYAMNPFLSFSMKIVRPIGQFFTPTYDGPVPGAGKMITLTETQQINCDAGKATYTLNTTYTNGIRNLSYSTDYLGPLQDAWFADVNVTNGFSFDDTPGAKNTLYWKNFQAAYTFAIIDSMLQPLTGRYRAWASKRQIGSPSGGPLSGYATFPNGSEILLDFMDISFPTDYDVGANNTLIAETLFNTKRNNQTDPGPDIRITADKLNKALFNVTLAAIYTFDFWRANVSATETQYQNVYSFSPQRVLVLPYTICLLVALPFLVLGWKSLRLNGVPAIDASFLQVLINTNGSKALRSATAGGCSDGSDKIPKELLDMKIQYSDLIAEDGAFKWAGLGTEDEVKLSKHRVND